MEGVAILTAFLGLFMPFLGASSNMRFLLTVLTVFRGDLAVETTAILFLTLTTFLLVTILPVVVCTLPCLLSRRVGARLIDLGGVKVNIPNLSRTRS